MKKALIILLIIFRGNIIAQTTSIKQFGVGLIAEPLTKSILYCKLLIDKDINKDIKIKKVPIFFYLIFSKNIYLKYNEKRITIKLFSREIGYRASYNYKRENLDAHYINVDVLEEITKHLELTHEHVYDLLSISYGSKKYRINKSEKYKINITDIECYHYIDIGFSINFPGEFYYEYLWIPPINVSFLTPKNTIIVPHTERETYEYYFVENFEGFNFLDTENYYSTIFSSTNISQWIINILIGLIENIFIEYAIEIPICTFLSLYPLHIHINIGTIIGTIEWLYKPTKNDDNNNKNIKNNNDKNLFLGYFFLFCLNSICVLKIGYYS